MTGADHIPIQRLAQVANETSGFSYDEFRHFRGCTECIERFRELVREHLRETKSKNKSDEPNSK